MRLILGVDGGQTSLKCAVADENGNILGTGSAPGITHLSAAGGRQTLASALQRAVQEAWKDARLQPGRLAAAALGLTGVSGAFTPEAALACEIVGEILPVERILVENDALIALKGAHLGQPGIIVIAGTGSIAMGVDASGRTVRAGGWGWLLGDEGSAYWIGRQAVRAALLAEEGRGAATSLVQILKDQFRIETMISIKRIVFAPDFGAQGFALLAPAAAQAATDGDATAAKIFWQAGQHLTDLAQVVARQLGAPLPVAPLGGAFEHFSLLSEAFSAQLQALNPPLQLAAARGSALAGAVILARELLLSTDPAAQE